MSSISPPPGYYLHRYTSSASDADPREILKCDQDWPDKERDAAAKHGEEIISSTTRAFRDEDDCIKFFDALWLDVRNAKNSRTGVNGRTIQEAVMRAGFPSDAPRQSSRPETPTIELTQAQREIFEKSTAALTRNQRRKKSRLQKHEACKQARG